MLRCRLPALLTITLMGGCAATNEYLDVPGAHRGARVGGEQTGEWTYFYEDGSVKAQGFYVEDEQDGLWSYWYKPGPDGRTQKQYEIEFAAGHLQGAYRCWYREGDPNAEGFFGDDHERGPWAFFAPEQRPIQIGNFVAGEMSLRWEYRFNSGQLRAEGYRLRDTMVGPWKFWDDQGDEYRELYPLPDDWKLVRELWPGGVVRREGFLLAGKPEGLWITWHQGGGRRMSGLFRDGQATGQWRAWDSEGYLVAVGEQKASEMQGDWNVIVRGVQESMPAYVFDPPRVPTGPWSADEIGTASPLEAVSTWLGEMLSPARPASLPANYDRPPPAALIATGLKRPAVKIPPQPWRVREETNLPAMVRLYSVGRQKLTARGGPNPYGSRSASESKGRTSVSQRLVGSPLPFEKLFTPEGEVDLSTYRGRKFALVIMRGFDGEVCVYCAAQTRALQKARKQFDAVAAEVLVVYPGDGDDLETFLQAVERLAQEGDEPAYEVCFDPSYELVKALDIEATRALPTTLLIDAEGIVRWAYVGKDKVDRPDVERMIDMFRKMSGS